MELWLLIVLGIGVLVVAWPQHLGRRRPVPVETSAEIDPPTPQPSVAVQVLFASQSAAELSIDCMLLEELALNGKSMPPGLPFSLRIGSSPDATLHAAACVVVAGWADEERVVALRLVSTDDTMHVRLSDDTTAIQLDLQEAHD